jgi:hypothetical protein
MRVQMVEFTVHAGAPLPSPAPTEAVINARTAEIFASGPAIRKGTELRHGTIKPTTAALTRALQMPRLRFPERFPENMRAA